MNKAFEQATREMLEQGGPYMGDDDSIFNRQYHETVAMAARPTIFVGVKAEDFRPDQLGDAATKKVEIADMTEFEAALDVNPRCDLIVIRKEFFQVARELSAKRAMPNCVCVSGSPGALKMEVVNRP